MGQIDFGILIKENNKIKNLECSVIDKKRIARIKNELFYKLQLTKNTSFLAIPCIVYKHCFEKVYTVKADLLSHDNLIDLLKLSEYDSFCYGWLTNNLDVISCETAFRWYHKSYALTNQKLNFANLKEKDIENILQNF